MTASNEALRWLWSSVHSARCAVTAWRNGRPGEDYPAVNYERLLEQNDLLFVPSAHRAVPDAPNIEWAREQEWLLVHHPTGEMVKLSYTALDWVGDTRVGTGHPDIDSRRFLLEWLLNARSVWEEGVGDGSASGVDAVSTVIESGEQQEHRVADDPPKPADTTPDDPPKPADTTPDDPPKPADTTPDDPPKPADTTPDDPPKPADTTPDDPPKPADTTPDDPPKPADTTPDDQRWMEAVSKAKMLKTKISKEQRQALRDWIHDEGIPPFTKEWTVEQAERVVEKAERMLEDAVDIGVEKKLL